MSWPVPAQGDIASRAAATYESAPALAGIDARSENSLAGITTRVIEGAVFDLYLFQGNLGQELMPDTAQQNLARHANVWGVPRLQAAGSSGYVSVSGVVGTVVPAGLSMTAPSGIVITSTAAVTIPSGGTVNVPVAGQASDGANGNLSTGTVVTFVSPVAGVAPQSATVVSAGLTDATIGLSGGTAIEDIEAWRARILSRIRLPAMGGSKADYETWCKDALDTVADVGVVPNAFGGGTVGIWIAMSGPRVPTSAELTVIRNYVSAVRPVTAGVTIQAATLTPVNFTIHLNPDTTAIRTAVQTALQLAFLTDATVGGGLFYSRLSAAISSASGEYSNELTVPSADIAGTVGVLLTLGTITWV